MVTKQPGSDIFAQVVHDLWAEFGFPCRDFLEKSCAIDCGKQRGAIGYTVCDIFSNL